MARAVIPEKTSQVGVGDRAKSEKSISLSKMAMDNTYLKEGNHEQENHKKRR